MIESRLSVAAIGLVFLSMLMPGFSQAAVGRTSGTFNVSSTGAATYQIPIWVPPGPKGIQPNLALTYNSQQGDGTLGPGWSLSGLGAITRCNKTYAQDGAASQVNLSTTDGYCLNGNRLRLTSGSYGIAESTYQTELANFSLITAKSSAGNGPAYFIVKGKDGLIYEYGNSADSRITPSSTVATAYQWLLNKVSDRTGNNYVVTYDTGTTGSTGIGVPRTISWTPNSYGSTSYNYTVNFTYLSDSDQGAETGYVSGIRTKNTNLLSSLAIKAGGATLRNYSLDYQVAPTTLRNRLAKMTECADDAKTNCLSPTTITYQDGQGGVAALSSTAGAASTPSLLQVVDLNGDGRQDIVGTENNGSVNYMKVWAQLATTGGYTTQIDTHITNMYYTDPLLVDDFDGDGKVDLLLGSGGTWRIYRWNGSDFISTAIGSITVDAARVGGGEDFASVDINGDGLPDLLSVHTDQKIYLRLNTSANGIVSFSTTETVVYDNSTAAIPTTGGALRGNNHHVFSLAPLKHLDFNGDHRDDVMVKFYQPSTSSYVAFELVSMGGTYVKGAAVDDYSLPVNWNNDSCTDLLDGIYIYLAACDGTLNTITIPAYSLYAPGYSLNFIPIDWDGDGRTDLLGFSNWQKTQAAVILSTGDGATSPINVNLSLPSQTWFFPIDQDGSGLDDLAYADVNSGNYPYPLYFGLHNGASTPPDLVTSITDGYGNFVRPSYVPITQGKYSTWADATYPYQNYIGPLYVVDQATFSDPSNSNATYQQGFWYAAAWKNLQGRGFVGFGAMQRYDSRNGLWETWNYGREFPYTGMLTADTVAQTNTNSILVNVLSNTLATTTLDATANNQRYFPYVSLATSSAYEVGGSKNGQLIAQNSTSFAYDNYGNLTSSTATSTDKDSASPQSPTYNQTWTKVVTNTISPDTTNWCLSIPTQTTVQQYATNVSSITRTMSFTPDYVNCRVSQQVVEPSSSAYKVTTGYGYDSFGNINSQTVTGINMTARTTTANWGTTGQFPISVTNALSQTSTAGYDYNLGLQTSQTDANNLTTSWQYDSFGRKTLETRPDQASTLWTYSLCSGCDPLPRMVVTTQPRDSAGNVMSTRTDYFDMLDRPIYQLNQLLDGSNAWTTRNYDALGNVQYEYFPYPQSGANNGRTTYSYDALNRVTQVQRPISASNSTLQSTTIAYQGLTTVTTDPQGKQTTKIVDPNGWLRRSQDHNGYYQSFSYDGFGSLKTVTDSQSNTLFSASYVYGIGAFQTATTDMDLGTWGYTPDALGEVVAYTDAKSSAFSLTYDLLSRPLTRFVSGEGTTTWTWGSAAASHNIGKLQSLASTGATTETYTYDSLSRLTNRNIVSDATYNYDYTYSSTTGLQDSMTYPLSTSGYRMKLIYSYQNGVLSKVADANGVTVYWQANAMNPRGEITQETLGNGIVTNRSYDAVTGYLNSIQSGVGGGTGVQNESYLFDQVGNVTQRQNNALGLTESFYYDNLYRLDYSQLNGVTNLDMTYDALGNITNRTDVASNAAWTYDSTHKHQVKQAGDSSHTYTYDANGNAITRNGASIAWSKYNYPTVINGSGTVNVTLSYDANNQRWKQSYTDSSGAIETTTYVGGLFEKVVSGTLTDWRFYVYADNEPVAVYSMKSNGVHALRYLVEDHQGSLDKITSSTGTVYASESFSAYGARRKATTWSGTPTVTDQNTMNGVTRQGYTWQTTMDNLSLVHMNGRVEDSVTGRFLSADPYITEPGNTQNYNRYSYVYNNPLSFTDPSGFNCDDQNSPNIGQCTDYSGGSSGAGWGGGGKGDFTWADTYTTSDGVWHVDWKHLPFDPISIGLFASSSIGNGSTGNEGTSLAAPSPLPTATPQTQKPCLAPRTFASDMANRKAALAGNAPIMTTEKALVGVGLMDVSLNLQNTMDTAAGRQLYPGFKVAAGVTTTIGTAATAYSLYGDVRRGDGASATLHGADLTVGTAGVVFPPAAPFALGYGLARAFGDFLLWATADTGSVMDKLPTCSE